MVLLVAVPIMVQNGITNFVNLFGGGGLTITFGYSFVRVLIWTLVWAVFATFTTYIGGILLSILINHKRVKGKKMWRTLFMVTIAVPQFVSLLLVRNFFANGGIVNTICANIGLTEFLRDAGLISTSYIPFLSSPGWAHVMIVLINIWVGVPFQMLIATGALMNLPLDQVESARIDGANSWTIFRKITLPLLAPTFLFVSTIALTNSFKLVDHVVIMTEGAPNNASTLLLYYIYQQGFTNFNYGVSSALTTVMLLLLMVVALPRFLSQDKKIQYN